MFRETIDWGESSLKLTPLVWRLFARSICKKKIKIYSVRIKFCGNSARSLETQEFLEVLVRKCLKNLLWEPNLLDWMSAWVFSLRTIFYTLLLLKLVSFCSPRSFSLMIIWGTILPFLFSLRARPCCWADKPNAFGGCREAETTLELPAFSWFTVPREVPLLLKMLLMRDPAVFLRPCSSLDMKLEGWGTAYDDE